ncbi:hypothetical protein N7541_002051 [Penicillium brevicompactum]|uniref:Uncharacterized protein n=1 Tax=Penicillium brevicompactum TaxID=5074 RepID=A0A9W9UNE0_PENBR|nr:hypothetical protein N7452_000226 [Penicillium brevicompactum]KAJ5361207.1 hypothetical protein N7541_002051 [Penicillium brevicompactum]
MYWPTKRNEWWLCGVLLTQAIITIALEIYIFVEWQSWVTPTIFQVPVSYLIPINLAILIFACVYESVLTLDAIHNKNNILLFAICISNACSFAYAVMQYQLMETTTTRLFHDRFGYPTLIDTTRNVWSLVQPAEVIVSIVTGICTLAMIPCVYLLHREYSWAIYKCVNGSRKTRMRYLFYEIFLVLIKVNFYFLIGFIVQYNLIYVHTKNLEWTLAMCLIPAAFICMLLGVYFVQHERTWGVIGIIVCYLGVIAYLISRIIILFGDSILGKDMMLLFAFASLALTVATVVCAIVCITNFDRGFKKINRSKNGSGRSSQYSQAHSLPLSNPYLRPPSRLTLE